MWALGTKLDDKLLCSLSHLNDTRPWSFETDPFYVAQARLYGSPASASQVLGLQVCAITPEVMYNFWVVLGLEPRASCV